MSEYSIGVEEEYQLVDPETGALRSRARDVLETDWSSDIAKEALETTVEVGTSICGSAAEVDAELRRLRTQVGTAAAAEGLDMVAAGLHPYARWQSQHGTRTERYDRIQERYGRIAADENKFGMHIHVAVPDPEDRLVAFNVVRGFLPHLLALSASSPIYEGTDTGFASYRAVLWRRWPFAGMPPRFGDMAEHDRFVDRLVEAGVIMDRFNIYWSLRLHPRYPTLEFRVTDACPRVEDAVAIAALTRALVVAAVERDLAAPAASSPWLEQELNDANEWAAARLGLEARLVEADGDAIGMRTAVRRVVDRVARHAERFGDGAALGDVAEILERGNAADRVRRELPELGGLEPLVSWLARETRLGSGLDRRRAQRAEAGG